MKDDTTPEKLTSFMILELGATKISALIFGITSRNFIPIFNIRNKVQPITIAAKNIPITRNAKCLNQNNDANPVFDQIK